MGMTRETQVAQDKIAGLVLREIFGNDVLVWLEPVQSFRDAPVFPSGYFAWTKFLLGAPTSFSLTRQVLSEFHGKSQPNCIGDGDWLAQPRDCRELIAR